MLTTQEKKNIYVAMLLLFTGSLVYLLFRQDVIFLSRVNQDVLHIFHISIERNDNILIYILLYCLPDGLWYAALLVFQVSFIQYGNINKFLFGVAVVLPFLLEILQLVHCIPGTFDLYDITTYLTTLLIFMLCKKNLLFKL